MTHVFQPNVSAHSEYNQWMTHFLPNLSNYLIMFQFFAQTRHFLCHSPAVWTLSFTNVSYMASAIAEACWLWPDEYFLFEKKVINWVLISFTQMLKHVDRRIEHCEWIGDIFPSDGTSSVSSTYDLRSLKNFYCPKFSLLLLTFPVQK